jgi:glyoxylase-like metal-dependent hydrolase (beta-lactamase superfamily II)
MRRPFTRSPTAQRQYAIAPAVLAFTVCFLLILERKAADGSQRPVERVSTPVAELSRDAERVHAPPLVPFPYRLVPGISILGGLEPSAAYVIETPKGLVLVDTGLETDASSLKSQMTSLGLDWKQVRAILITHAHGDHSGGAEHLRNETGAKVYAGRGDAAVLRAGGPREAIFSAFALPGGTLHPTTIDVELTGDESIDFGDVRIRVLATPGHTPGSVCYLLERDGLRALFTGDVITSLVGDDTSLIRARWPLGTYSAYLTSRYRGDARAYLSSLHRLRTMKVPDLVLPGHPRGDPSPQEPCLTQERWETLLDKGIHDMERLLSRYAADGTGLLDCDPKRLWSDLYYLGDLDGVAVYGFFASSRFFVVNAPGGLGLVAFIDDRLKRLGLKPAKPAAVLLTSCGPTETAGLKSLFDAHHPRVIAGRTDTRMIEETCGAGAVVLTPDALARQNWFDVTPIPLPARGPAAVAYQIRLGGKSVLFGGTIPNQTNEKTVAETFSLITKSKDATLDYLVALYRLAGLKPDLWLPAVAVDGQNANLYDSEWQDLIAYNYRLGYRGLVRFIGERAR